MESLLLFFGRGFGVRELRNNCRLETGMSGCTHHVQLPDLSRCLHMKCLLLPFCIVRFHFVPSKKMKINNQYHFAGCSVKFTGGINIWLFSFLVSLLK